MTYTFSLINDHLIDYVHIMNYFIIIQEMNKSGVWKSLESKPVEVVEGERQQGSKDNTPDEGIVIKVS